VLESTSPAVDLRQLFSPNTELEIEIGFGKGRFLLERTRSSPSSGLLGIEIKRKWAATVKERCERQRLTNVHVMAGSCLEILPRTTPDQSIRRVFIHFPDPWWKRRHAKRMVVGEATLDQIARLLLPDGELFLQTDVEERAQQYLDSIRAHGKFTLAGDGLISHNPYQARSNREVRAEQDGLPIYRILARRITTP